MPKFKTQYNAKEFPKNYEKNTLPSCTIPDQTMSIKTILDRFSKGLPVAGQRVPMYDEHNDLPDPRTLDLADRQVYKEMFQEELNQIQNKPQQAPKNDPPIPSPQPTP